jgi:hypothetical protein
MPNKRAADHQKLGIWIPEDLKKGVMELAASKRLTVTEWLEQILVRHVDRFRAGKAKKAQPKRNERP